MSHQHFTKKQSCLYILQEVSPLSLKTASDCHTRQGFFLHKSVAAQIGFILSGCSFVSVTFVLAASRTPKFLRAPLNNAGSIWQGQGDMLQLQLHQQQQQRLFCGHVACSHRLSSLSLSCGTKHAHTSAANSFSARSAVPQIHAVTTLQRPSSTIGLQQQPAQHSTPRSRPEPPEEDYKSSTVQKSIVAAAALLFATVELHGILKIDSPAAAAQCALAAFAGYLLAGESMKLYPACTATKQLQF